MRGKIGKGEFTSQAGPPDPVLRTDVSVAPSPPLLFSPPTIAVMRPVALTWTFVGALLNHVAITAGGAAENWIVAPVCILIILCGQTTNGALTKLLPSFDSATAVLSSIKKPRK
jgi:hypothetical protein